MLFISIKSVKNLRYISAKLQGREAFGLWPLIPCKNLSSDKNTKSPAQLFVHQKNNYISLNAISKNFAINQDNILKKWEDFHSSSNHSALQHIDISRKTWCWSVQDFTKLNGEHK